MICSTRTICKPADWWNFQLIKPSSLKPFMNLKFNKILN